MAEAAADPTDLLYEVVSRALDALMDASSLPTDSTQVTDSAVLLLWALIEDYLAGTSKVSERASALVEAFYNPADPVVSVLAPDTLMQVRATLNLLRQRKRLKHGDTAKEAQAPEALGALSGGGAGTGT